MERVLVCGGRNYHNRDAVFYALDSVEFDVGILVVIHGNAPGADSLGAAWARERLVPQLAFPADWETYGRSAGPRRNTQMLAEGKPTLAVVCPGGRGTRDMVKRLEKAGVRIVRVK